MEKKAELRARLEREGRWTEFCVRWKACEEVLRAEGRTDDAKRLAYKMAAKEFPAPENAAADVIANAPSRAKRAKKSAVDVKEVAKKLEIVPIPDELMHRECTEVESYRWVFANVGKPGVQPIHAPSFAAWNLLQEVTNDPELRRSLYSTLVPKLFPNKQQMEQEAQYRDDGRKDFDLVNKLIAEKTKDAEPKASGNEQVSDQPVAEKPTAIPEERATAEVETDSNPNPLKDPARITDVPELADDEL